MVVSWAPAVLAEDSLEQGLQRMTKTANIRTTPSKDAGLEKPQGAGGAQQLWLGPWAVMSRGGDRWVDGGAAGQGEEGGTPQSSGLALCFTSSQLSVLLSRNSHS